MLFSRQALFFASILLFSVSLIPFAIAQNATSHTVTSGTNMVLNGTIESMASINKAIDIHTIVAQVDINGSNIRTKSLDEIFSVDWRSIPEDAARITLIATVETGPKVLLVNLSSININVHNPKYIGIMYDGIHIESVQDINTILNAKSTDDPRFAIIATQSGAKILVLIPYFSGHFSPHFITIPDLSRVTPPRPNNCPYPDLQNDFASGSKITDNGAIAIEYRYSPSQHPIKDCPFEWRISFEKNSDLTQKYSAVHYDIFTLDNNGVKLDSAAQDSGKSDFFAPLGEDDRTISLNQSLPLTHFVIAVLGTGPRDSITDTSLHGIVKIDVKTLMMPEFPVKTPLPPIKQIKNGIHRNNVTCKDGFVLIENLHTEYVACVKPQTAQKLVERGWGTTQISLTKENRNKQSTMLNPVQIVSVKTVPSNPKVGDDIQFDIIIQNKANYPIYYGFGTCGSPPIGVSVTPTDNFQTGAINCICVVQPPVQHINPNDTISWRSPQSCFGGTWTIMKSGVITVKSTFLWGTSSQNPQTNSTSVVSTFNILPNAENPESICKANGGIWDEKYRECTGVSSQTCKALNGTYEFCSSPCRHIPNTGKLACAAVCVQVCTVK